MKPRPIAPLHLRAFFMVLGLLLAVGCVAYQSDWGAFEGAWRQLPLSTFIAILLLFILGSLLAGFRLWLIASDLGSPITAANAVRAVAVGSLAGALFFQLLGQTIARSYVLAKSGTTTAATVAMTGYEKALALVVSVTLGGLGAWLLFGRISLDMQHGGQELIKIVLTGVVAACGGYLGWRQYARSQLSSRYRNLFAGLTRNMVVTVAIQLCTMAAYILVARELAPNISLLRLASASAVIMLAASLPISFAGWGIRELSAVVTLGAIGLSPEKALIVAVLIGLSSMLAFVVILPFGAVIGARPRDRLSPQSAEHVNFAVIMSWVIPLAIATAIFLQIQVPLNEGTKTTANLADPLALCGSIIFLASCLQARKWPQWWLPNINLYLVAITLVLTAGLIIGWQSFGWTTWAFTNKYLGWFVLLAYAATPAMLVSIAGEQGWTALFRTYIGTGTAIALVEIAIAGLKCFGVPLDESVAPFRAAGMAGNPNAFAFQMTLLLCASIVLLRSRLAVFPIAIALIAIVLSASRAGMGTAAAIFVFAGYLMPERWRVLLQSLGIAAVVTGVFLLSDLGYIDKLANAFHAGQQPATFAPVGPPGVATAVAPSLAKPKRSVLMSSYRPEVSDPERIKTIQGGWLLFRSHPAIGAGLGAFAEGWRQKHGQVQVIHSTPLWLLAEFGLIGTAVVALPFLHLLLWSIRRALAMDPQATLIFLACVSFAMMGAVHDMFYQRPFWFLIGASVALRAAVTDKAVVRQSQLTSLAPAQIGILLRALTNAGVGSFR